LGGRHRAARQTQVRPRLRSIDGRVFCRIGWFAKERRTFLAEPARRGFVRRSVQRGDADAACLPTGWFFATFQRWRDRRYLYSASGRNSQPASSTSASPTTSPPKRAASKTGSASSPAPPASASKRNSPNSPPPTTTTARSC
jgi:hypothetical protein